MKTPRKSPAGLKPLDCLWTVLYGLLLALLYRSTFAYLFRKWQNDDFTYCYAIPFIVLFLIWEKREQLAATPSLPSLRGLIPLAIGLICYWLGELGGEFTILFLSLW